ncbi:MAG TPA: hypothetical protein VGK73_22880 [Polyangiaceae bacterium]
MRGKLGIGAIAPILGLVSSCSLVYDLSPDQCGKNSDCDSFGQNYRCEEGLCVYFGPSSGGSSGTDGTGGTGDTGGTESTGATSGSSTGGSSGSGGKSANGGKGGSNTAGKGGSSGRGGEGGSGDEPSTGGTAGTGATGGKGGSSGSGGTPPECETHDDCFELNGEDEPWACIDDQCQALTTEDCPLVLPSYYFDYENLRSSDAIIVGAFARLDQGGSTPVIENFDLAFEEIALEAGGIPASGDTRQVVAVLCNSYYEQQTDLLVAVDHLIETLKVPAILATLDTRDQQYVWEERARDAGVFLMVPIESDDRMVNLMDDGRVHHMLSGPHDLAITYQPLIDMTISHLQNNGTLGPSGGPFEDARISLVRARDDRFLNDLGVDFRDRVRWNGNLTSGENETNGDFVTVGTDSEPPQRDDQSLAVDTILSIDPHIVVGATDSEMTASVNGGFQSIIELIEERWDDDPARQTQPRPFYILSPFNYGGARNTLLAKYPAVRQRLLGIAWPATLDLPAYTQYKQAYLEKYPGGINYNRENIYDAAYFLTYGLVAAGPTIRGQSIADGMIRLTTGSVEYNVGRSDLADGFTFLSTSLNNEIDLIGSNGKPDWDAGGGRHNPASVWCIDSGSLYVGDVLTYDEQSQMLTGTFPPTCFTYPVAP